MGAPDKVTTEGSNIVTVHHSIINSAASGLAWGIGIGLGIWIVGKIATAGMPAPEGMPQ